MQTARGRRGLRGLRGMLVALAAITAGAVVLAPAARAEPSRFIPWRGATPALSLADLDGRRHTLEDYRGKVVLLNFWATWCEPCIEEMPSMQTLERRLVGRPFAILAVNHGESRPKVAEFTRRLTLGLRVLLDPNTDAPRAWRVRVLPASFLVDATGRVRYSVIGEMDWAGEGAVEAVRRLLP
ncbi:MAG: redoxin domain-containing protein [Candidatus Rokuibacteriota bacterium]